MQIQANSRSISPLICLVAVILICLTGIHGHEVWTPDEPRVAAISLAMAHTGDYVIPHLAGKPFLEKPPLYFAAAALMLKMVGSLTAPTTVIRFTSVIFGFGVLWLTFLLGKRLWDSEIAWTSVLILGTMVGFVENFHWIRVDAALAFFVLAAIWCFVEIYFEKRFKLLPLAGLLVAASFLCKGLIGPVLIGIPWLAIVALTLRADKETPLYKQNGFWIYHGLSFLILILTCGLWILSIYMQKDKSLWNEWFWVNQVGRLTGTAVSKGHIKPGEPFYYVEQLLVYGLPWVPLIFYWFGQTTLSLVKRRSISPKTLFLYCWGVGSLVLLSIPATKRGIYLAPVMPAYAFMTAVSLKDVIPKWFKSYAEFWNGLCIILMTVLLALPLLGFALPKHTPPQVREFITHFNFYHGIIAVLLVLGLLLMVRFRSRFALVSRMVLMTSALLVALLGLPMQAVDLAKNMHGEVTQFVDQIPEVNRARIAGTGFSETMLANFYYYTGWSVPQIGDQARIKQILTGNDATYDSLIVNKRGKILKARDIPEAAFEILLQTVIGRKRGVYWIKGPAVQIANDKQG